MAKNNINPSIYTKSRFEKFKEDYLSFDFLRTTKVSIESEYSIEEAKNCLKKSIEQPQDQIYNGQFSGDKFHIERDRGYFALFVPEIKGGFYSKERGSLVKLEIKNEGIFHIILSMIFAFGSFLLWSVLIEFMGGDFFRISSVGYFVLILVGLVFINKKIKKEIGLVISYFESLFGS